MRLLRLAIGRLPGIQPGFELEGLDPGVNLVLGPNASGKSSLIRALRYLVVPPSAEDPADLILAATLEGAGSRWEVTRTGRGLLWRRDGTSAPSPELPKTSFLHCYWLCLEDLLGNHDDDRALLERLRRELSGGFDLAALRQAEPLRLRPRHGQHEERALRDAESVLRQVQRQHHELRQHEAALPELDRVIERAQGAGAQARLCQQAGELLRIQLARRGDETGLRETADGGEGLARRLVEIIEECRAHRQEAVEGGAALEATGLHRSFPAPETLSARRRDLDRLVGLLRDREEASRGLERAQLERRQAAEALGSDPEAGPPRLEPELVSAAEEVAHATHRCELEARELAARLSALDVGGSSPAEPGEELERHERAAAELRRWLRSGAAGWRWPTVALAGVASVASVTAYLLKAPSISVVAMGAGALALVALLLTVGLSRERAEARRRFAETGIAPPTAWFPSAVGSCLEALERELAELRGRRREAAQRSALQQELVKAERRLEESQAELEELARRAGFEPRTTLDFYRFVRLVEAWDRAAREVAAGAAEVDRLGREMQPLAETISHFLLEWGETPPADGADPGPLREALERLEARARDAEQARRQADDAERALTRLEQELQRLEDERAAAIREIPELQALVEAGDQVGIEARRRELEEEASRAGGQIEERARIRSDLDRARRGHDLEEALAKRDQARTELEAAREQAVHAAAGLFLLDQVEREHRVESQPALLREAGARFSRFTHHAFSLELAADGTLVARDRALGELRSAAELSTGTRMQLFLALRMAWARAGEGEHGPLPIFLDEALTTSDPERFAEVARALETLATDEGRQIFYLTAQETDRVLWERGTGSRPHLVDLLRARHQGSSVAAEELHLEVRPTLTEPAAGESPESYANRAGVTTIDPFRDAGLIHPFHLLRDDLPTLHRLLDLWRVETLGQLEAWLERPAGRDAVGHERARLLRLRIDLARCWVEAFRVGRGRPVDRSVLERSQAVSDAFLERVAALAGEVEGSAVGLLDGLREGRVARFQSAKTEELEAWLEAHSYLDRRQPLDGAGRRLETLLALGVSPSEDSLAAVLDWLEAGCSLAAEPAYPTLESGFEPEESGT